MSKFEIGDYIVNKATGDILSVDMIAHNHCYWSGENHLKDECGVILSDTDEVNNYEVLTNFVVVPSGGIYKINKSNKVNLKDFDFALECAKCSQAGFFEMMFLKDGYQEIFEVRDQLALNMIMHKFELSEFVEASMHFLQDGCSHYLLSLAESEEE